jgi:hypothetical protein
MNGGALVMVIGGGGGQGQTVIDEKQMCKIQQFNRTVGQGLCEASLVQSSGCGDVEDEVGEEKKDDHCLHELACAVQQFLEHGGPRSRRGGVCGWGAEASWPGGNGWALNGLERPATGPGAVLGRFWGGHGWDDDRYQRCLLAYPLTAVPNSVGTQPPEPTQPRQGSAKPRHPRRRRPWRCANESTEASRLLMSTPHCMDEVNATREPLLSGSIVCFVRRQRLSLVSADGAVAEQPQAATTSQRIKCKCSDEPLTATWTQDFGQETPYAMDEQTNRKNGLMKGWSR